MQEQEEVSLESVFEQIKLAMEMGDLIFVRQLCADILVNIPEEPQALKILDMVSSHIASNEASLRFIGPHYQDWLQLFHEIIQPSGYLEIGIDKGKSLRLVNPGSKAIGIDPAFQIEHSCSTWTKLYRETSDQFFQDHDTAEIFEGATLDLAFIDGLHTFDQALKDFMNIEKQGHNNTIVLAHDVFPVEPITASRTRMSTFWVGDTWKLIPILREYRPDLTIFTIPTFPSGLGVIANLNPTSTVLDQYFDAIVAEYMTKLDDKISTAETLLNPVINHPDPVLKALERHIPRQPTL